MAIGWLDGLLSAIFNDGLEVERGQGLNFADGIRATHNTTTKQIDITVVGGSWDAARVATTAALPANTRTGNTLTADANGAFPSIDGVALAEGARILVKDEAAGANNGLYVLATAGGASAPWSLTRATDADSSDEFFDGRRIAVGEGTVNGDRAFKLSTNAPIVLNTTALTFELEGSELLIAPGGGDDLKFYHANAGNVEPSDLLYRGGNAVYAESATGGFAVPLAPEYESAAGTVVDTGTVEQDIPTVADTIITIAAEITLDDGVDTQYMLLSVKAINRDSVITFLKNETAENYGGLSGVTFAASASAPDIVLTCTNSSGGDLAHSGIRVSTVTEAIPT